MAELDVTCVRCQAPLIPSGPLWVSTPDRSYFCKVGHFMHQAANAQELALGRVAALCTDALATTPKRTWHAGCLAAAILVRLSLPVRRHDDRGRVVAPCPDCLAITREQDSPSTVEGQAWSASQSS